VLPLDPPRQLLDRGVDTCCNDVISHPVKIQPMPHDALPHNLIQPAGVTVSINSSAGAILSAAASTSCCPRVVISIKIVLATLTSWAPAATLLDAPARSASAPAAPAAPCARQCECAQHVLCGKAAASCYTVAAQRVHPCAPVKRLVLLLWLRL
jgi:hypothetical protein